MSELNKNIEWLENDIVPKVCSRINQPSKICKIIWSTLNGYFLSEIFFADVIFESENEENSNVIIHLMFKILPKTRFVSTRLEAYKFFQNEILFYKKISEDSPRYPRFYYGTADDIDKTIIVLENVSKRGFKMCSQLYDTPFKYVINSVREIAKFHSMGYVMKEKYPEKLTKIKANIQEGKFIIGGDAHKMMKIVGLRPIEWLRKINYDNVFCDKMEKCLEDSFTNIILDAVKPIEPLAVLIHGDFTTSNMLFREISSGIETMLIDFGLIRYGSPAIDLSTLLFLNAATENRRGHFDEIFKAYHDSLLEYLRDAGITDLEKYSFQNMLADYKRRAAYGYMIALYFLPVLYGFCDGEDNNLEERALRIKKAGGDSMSAKFADILLELRDTGCLKHFL